MTCNDEVARGETCEVKREESHGELNTAQDEWDDFRVLLVDQGEPDELLFAREVQDHPGPSRESIESFPGHKLFM
jgi:hypothetical protein